MGNILNGAQVMKPIKVKTISGRAGEGLPPMTTDQTWKAVFVSRDDESQGGSTLIELFREGYKAESEEIKA